MDHTNDEELQLTTLTSPSNPLTTETVAGSALPQNSKDDKTYGFDTGGIAVRAIAHM